MTKNKKVILMGNPNVGKSTIFNEITGSHQHTGNWTGKTVGAYSDTYDYKYCTYELVDLPGTYSLLSSSEEERLARDYLCFEDYDCVVCVVDATNPQRNLNLVFQVLELTDKVVLLLNLCDEAKKKNITIDTTALEKSLGVPVVKATARSGKGINELLEVVHKIANNTLINDTATLFYSNSIEESVHKVTRALKANIDTDKNFRFLALRLLEGNESFDNSFKEHFGADILQKGNLRGSIQNAKSRMKALGINVSRAVTEAIFKRSDELTAQVVSKLPSKKEQREAKLDKLLLGKYTSIPIMLVMMGLILWLTISASNYPSACLQNLFSNFELWLAEFMKNTGIPPVIISLLVNGILRVLLWVIAVMLPPMAIFFPLFAILEDFGILPRIAFNLDSAFEHCGACGKQALTTCMGYGCNAVGVTGARIIDSPRERLVAIITNSLTPCNGRFPLLIAIISMFFCYGSIGSTGILLLLIATSMVITMAVSRLLTATLLKGVKSSFVLELPPYRKPKLLSLIKDTIREKILSVLLRAVIISAPAGLLIWILANITIGDLSLLAIISTALDPFGRLMGLDGVLLLAFILGFPANEIVIPIALMMYLGTNEMGDYSSLESLKEILVSNGWTYTTAICTCIFSMFHFPCSTTLLTIYKETKSIKWTAISVIIPLMTGIILCSSVALISKLIAG